MEDVLYTVPEAAGLMKTSKAYVYSLIKAGHIPVLKLGKMKILRSSLLQFLQAHEGYDLTDPNNIHPMKGAI